MTVSINGVYSPTFKNGVLIKETLNPANETVNRGYYAATTLSAVDADLATANIKNGITIFGKVGSADVQDISDATAIAAEVVDGETFYAVSGGIRTGTMAVVAITAANDNYPAGYHAGNVGGLDAIDVHLAPANIKLGVDIFGKVGTYTPALAADASESSDGGPGAGGEAARQVYSDQVIAGETEVQILEDTITTVAGRLVIFGAYIGVNDQTYQRLYVDDVQKVNSNARKMGRQVYIYYASWDGAVTADTHTVKQKVYNAIASATYVPCQAMELRSIKVA